MWFMVEANRGCEKPQFTSLDHIIPPTVTFDFSLGGEAYQL